MNLLKSIAIFALFILIGTSCNKENEIAPSEFNMDGEKIEKRYQCNVEWNCTDFPFDSNLNSCEFDLSYMFDLGNPDVLPLLVNNSNSIELSFESPEGISFEYDSNLNDLASYVSIKVNGQGIISQPVNKIIVDCGSEIRFTAEYKNGSVVNDICFSTLVCWEKCCTPKDCCEGVSMEYTKVPLLGDCCTYNIKATNNTACTKELSIGRNPPVTILPYSMVEETTEICKSKLISVIDEDGTVCYEDEIDCTCCSLLDIKVRYRGNNLDGEDSMDCCFYAVTLENFGDCDLYMNDKFNNPIVVISPGDKRTTWQRACNGNDNVYNISTKGSNGQFEVCDSITLSADCEDK